MSNELAWSAGTGLTLYVQVFDPSQTKFWNGSAWEAYASGHWSTYKIALTEVGVGMYLANFPTGITLSGSYTINAFQQAGGSPATTDTVLGSGSVDWNGSAETPDFGNVSISAGNLHFYDANGNLLRTVTFDDTGPSKMTLVVGA